MNAVDFSLCFKIVGRRKVKEWNRGSPEVEEKLEHLIPRA